MTIEIHLGRGLVALVDDTDAEKVGGVRWYAHRTGRGVSLYARAEPIIAGKKVRLLMHRLILDARPGQLTDHIDGDGLNNCRSNLRFCTHAENMRNRRKYRTSDRNPFKGVYCYAKTGKWLAIIGEDKKQIPIGVFSDPIEAAKAYDEEARKRFGGFANLNFP